MVPERQNVLLTDFRVISLDCYGTLIDWERGIVAGLQPLLGRVHRSVPPDELLATFGRLEAAQQALTPWMPYAELLTVVHGQMAQRWGIEARAKEDARFGESVPDWPAFADAPDALRYLERHYTLVVLSNVDGASFAASNARLGVTFGAVYTAEDIGSYKPDPRNFAYLLARLGARGVAHGEILHAAQSLFHDHEPASAAGLATCWIDRRHATGGWGATPPPAATPRTDFRFKSLAAMVRAHRIEIGETDGM